MKDYCIKAGYKPQEKNFTYDVNRKAPYWSRGRILQSLYWQYYVYSYAAGIAKKYGVKSVLDLGCGPAIKLNKLIAKHVSQTIGVDQPDIIEFCNQKYPIGLYISDNFEKPKNIDMLPHVDLIICSDVIEHIVEPDNILMYIKQIAKRDTLIIFSTPERDKLRGKDCMGSTKPEHVREWNGEEFKRYITNSGFKIKDYKLQYPLKLSLRSMRTYFTIFFRQKSRNLSFKYNQVVLCKLA
jgi:SAM-dependent methyltransferase